MGKRNGFAAIMMTLSLVFLLAVGGLVTDLGWAYYRKQKAQTAAESAVMAATSYARTNGLVCGTLGVLCQSTPTNCTSLTGTTSLAAGCSYAKYNGFNDGASNVTVMLSSGTGSPTGVSGVNSDYWVQASITENVFPMFSAVLGGHNRLNITTVATSASVAGQVGGAVYVLNTNTFTPSVTTDGSLNLASAGDIWVANSSSSAVQFTGSDTCSFSGNCQIHTVSGSCQNHSSGSIPAIAKCTSNDAADPLSQMPMPSNTGMTTYSGDYYLTYGTTTLNPGRYTGDINCSSHASLTLNPGTYEFDGDFTFGSSHGTLSGSGVTMYMKSGRCNISNGTVNLSAPTSGNYRGVTICQDRSNTNSCTLTAGSSQKISGVVYCPSATVHHCGGSSSTPPNQTIVCNKISYTGATNYSVPPTTLYTASRSGFCQ